MFVKPPKLVNFCHLTTFLDFQNYSLVSRSKKIQIHSRRNGPRRSVLDANCSMTTGFSSANFRLDNKLFQKKKINDQKTILPYGGKLCGITPLSFKARGQLRSSRLLLRILSRRVRILFVYFGLGVTCNPQLTADCRNDSKLMYDLSSTFV